MFNINPFDNMFKPKAYQSKFHFMWGMPFFVLLLCLYMLFAAITMIVLSPFIVVSGIYNSIRNK